MGNVKKILETNEISYSETTGGILIHRSNLSYDLRKELSMVGVQIYPLDTTVYIYTPKN